MYKAEIPRQMYFEDIMPVRGAPDGRTRGTMMEARGEDGGR